MREFVYFSNKAVTTGNFKDLMKAGRMDIVCHFVINSLFISNNYRDDVKLHLFFYGPPDPPKHLEIMYNEKISKKDVAGLIKRILYKYKYLHDQAETFNIVQLSYFIIDELPISYNDIYHRPVYYQQVINN